MTRAAWRAAFLAATAVLAAILIAAPAGPLPFLAFGGWLVVALLVITE